MNIPSIIRPVRGILLLLVVLMMSIQACVSEDELDFPDKKDSLNLSESVAIVSTLRAVEKSILLEDNRFQVLYPLELQFNNDLRITISDFDGLKSVAENSSISQHVDAIAFPFDVLNGDIEKTIQNEQSFINLLDDVEIPTLRDEFDPFFTQCFDLVYPIKMLDTDSNEITIASKEAYFAFELDQGFDKQPKFIYPIAIFDYASESNKTIASPFELFEVFDACKKCPQLSFRIDTVEIDRYQFTADFEELDRVFSYGWYINGEKVETDGTGVQGDNMLIETFPEGNHEICIKATLPEDDCFSGTEYCQIISVDPCPFVSFETETINNSTYKFIANFPAKDLIEYTWAIYRNEQLIFSQLEDIEGDNELFYQFDAGTYKVCLESERAACPEVLKFCDNIVVE
ncbi:MAG: hypothetical protein ABJG47_13805 [Ekhidna sp.]